MNFFAERCPHCGLPIEVITEPQKVAFQLLCMDIDRQRQVPEGSGHHLGAKAWKQMLISAWERAHDREVEVLPAIDGVGWDVVFRRADRLSKTEASEIIAFADAWCAERGIVRSKSRRELREGVF